MEEKILKFYMQINAISEQLKSISNEIEKINLNFIDEVLADYLVSVSKSNVEYD